MKMNGPVHCASFFRDQIKRGREGLWCVSLSPNGEILSLIDTQANHPGADFKIYRHIKSHINRTEPSQIVLVRYKPTELTFSDWDWKWVQRLKKLCRRSGCVFCDYIKLNPKGFCSLLDLET